MATSNIALTPAPIMPTVDWANTNMATIMDLPAEMIIAVSSYLTTTELGQMRCCCKQIEQHLFEGFAKEFFTKRQFMVEHDSLKTLVAIANHSVLSKRLREVIISTQHRGQGSFMTAAEVDRYLEAGEADREILIATGLARELLQEAFSKLTNLKSVGVRDFDGSGRVRDGPHARWRSWGWATYPSASLQLGQDGSAVFALVVAALGTGPARISKLEVILRHSAGLPPGAFYISTSTAPMLANVKSLMLDIGDSRMHNADPVVVKVHREALRRFLASSPSLEAIRLNFRRDDGRPGTESVLEWLGQPVQSVPAQSGSSTTPPVLFAKLKKLDIGYALVRSSTLLAVLTKFALTSFSLWNVNLMCNAPDAYADPDGCVQLLQDLARLLKSSSVTSVKIGRVGQSTLSSNWPHQHVTFVPEGTKSGDKPKLLYAELQHEVNYRARYGLSVSQWLEGVADRVWDWNLRKAVILDSSGEEGDEDEDEDEDDGDDDDE